MHIIHIGTSQLQTLTADSTLVTADNASITADATGSLLTGTYTLDILPREFSTTVKVIMYNELEETTTSFFNNPTTTSRGLMRISFDTTPLSEGTSYAATVKNTSGSLLWRGKIYCTEQTDFQEFKVNVPSGSNNIIKI